jgi:glycosyltransferase involved in cell wall biosynthesis
MFEKEINPENIQSAEVVVCIPSYNEAESIAFPTQIADSGLSQFLSEKQSVLINCDNNSPDNTRDVFLNTPTKAPKIYLSTEPGVRGKGNNFRNLFQKVKQLNAKAIAVVDADLKSITPEWIKHLTEPLFQDFDYVAPIYLRHKYDGTITNGIAYPMTRSLYGRRVRQPIGGDFGFSSRLNDIYLKGNSWSESVSNFGIDIWMTSLAIRESVPICQAFMGQPKIHRAKDPGSALGPMFRQVVGTIYDLMIQSEDKWKDTKWSRPTAIYGFNLGEQEQPPPVEVNTKTLYDKFQAGFTQYENIWKHILTNDVFNKLNEINEIDQDRFDFPTQLWAKVLFDIAVAYRDLQNEREDIMDSLIPIYFGKTLSFVRKTERMSMKQAEEFIDNECLVVEETRPYLNQRWKGE